MRRRPCVYTMRASTRCCFARVVIREDVRQATRRTFFASSTDHTVLLRDAQVHSLVDNDIGVVRYVMAADGTDLATVQKVPQLHLARLDRKDNTLFGAKVVNRTLGTPTEVCGKLVDRALQDIGSTSGTRQARGTLHGLSPWVLRGLQHQTSIRALSNVPSAELEAIAAIARGAAGAETYEVGRRCWESLIAEFVETDRDSEAALYRSKGGRLMAVEHHADQSEYADMSSGSMAFFNL